MAGNLTMGPSIKDVTSILKFLTPLVTWGHFSMTPPLKWRHFLMTHPPKKIFLPASRPLKYQKKIILEVTSLFDNPLPHVTSRHLSANPPSPLGGDVLYGRPLL